MSVLFGWSVTDVANFIKMCADLKGAFGQGQDGEMFYIENLRNHVNTFEQQLAELRDVLGEDEQKLSVDPGFVYSTLLHCLTYVNQQPLTKSIAGAASFVAYRKKEMGQLTANLDSIRQALTFSVAILVKKDSKFLVQRERERQQQSQRILEHGQIASGAYQDLPPRIRHRDSGLDPLQGSYSELAVNIGGFASRVDGYSTSQTGWRNAEIFDPSNTWNPSFLPEQPSSSSSADDSISRESNRSSTSSHRSSLTNTRTVGSASFYYEGLTSAKPCTLVIGYNSSGRAVQVQALTQANDIPPPTVKFTSGRPIPYVHPTPDDKTRQTYHVLFLSWLVAYDPPSIRGVDFYFPSKKEHDDFQSYVYGKSLSLTKDVLKISSHREVECRKEAALRLWNAHSRTTRSILFYSEARNAFVEILASTLKVSGATIGDGTKLELQLEGGEEWKRAIRYVRIKFRSQTDLDEFAAMLLA